jgi:hypothetical protein
MHLSRPSLHAPIALTPSQQTLVLEKASAIAAAHFLSVLQAPVLAPTGDSFEIPLTTISFDGNFDAHINIRFKGMSDEQSVRCLIVDSGSSVLIVPDYAGLAALANFTTDYQVLARNVQEPWGCPANIVKGPIEIPTKTHGVYTINNCVFYACTGANSDGKRTKNFGAGWISPWPQAGGVTIQAPLSYNTDYPCAEFNYAPASTIFQAGATPAVAAESSLTLYRSPPSGYQMFEIIRNLYWMSLRPLSLSIGATKTGWPGNVDPPPIAMVDTGGGPVFLSDPKGYVYNAVWPDPVDNPPWTAPCSISCQSTKDDLMVGLGDGNNSFSYRIDTSQMPQSVQGLTLVMCKACYFMMGEHGMNIGGVSALFNQILVDYSAGKVGFKSKPIGFNLS